MNNIQKGKGTQMTIRGMRLFFNVLICDKLSWILTLHIRDFEEERVVDLPQVKK